MLNEEIRTRVQEIAEYIAATGATVRTAAKIYGVSKSTVHKDMTQRLRYVDGELQEKVSKILAINREERHIRGGMATKRKYKVDNRV